MKGLRDREQHFRFPFPELMVEASDPSSILPHTLNYLTAMSYAVDMPPEQRELYVDVGCGSGYGTEMIAPFFRKSLGIDRDETAITYAKRLHSRAGTEFIKNEKLGPRNLFGAVDYCTMIEVLEHVPTGLAEVLLSEISGWLTPNGMLYLTTPIATTNDGTNPDNPWHLHEYQPAELKALLGKFFGKVGVTVGQHMSAICSEPKT
jgi:2-polyprenyl-3-methyl-5-hydroxy-6-metoxy-1,4-benzoquinol methylase